MVLSWVKVRWHNLKVPFYEPGPSFAEEMKLCFGGKDKMASTVYSYISLKEAVRNVFLFQTEIQVHWVFGPGVLSNPITCSLHQ